jgi:KDO2-lipid IV(A) lauroyltransferase
MTKPSSHSELRIGLGQALRYSGETIGFFLIIAFFSLFAVDRASRIGGWIGRNIVARVSRSTRARNNLRIAFPDISEAETTRIVNAMWDNLGRVMAEYAHLDRLHSDGAEPRIEITGLENLRAAQAAGKGLLLISGHFANWEVMPFAARDYGFSGGVVVRPTNNPFVARWLDRKRSANGMPMQIAKGAQGTKRIFTLLRKNEAICMLVDQRASEGIPAPFFDQDVMTTPVPAVLALKLDAVIVPATNRRVKDAHFHMHIYPPIVPQRSGDQDADVLATTAAINAFIETRVRECPEQWLWIHKRWTEGKVMMTRRAQLLSGGRDGATNATSSRV